VPDHVAVSPAEVLAALELPPPVESVPMQGSEATVWRVRLRIGGQDRPYALRLHRAGSTTAARELVGLEVAAGLGVPVPEVVATGSWAGRPVALTSWCPGGTAVERLTRTEPSERLAVARRFGAVQARLHTADVPATAMAALRPVVRAVPDFDPHAPVRLLHLDYHPLNVLDDGARVTGVVDWANTALGDPRLDLARTLGIFALASLFDVVDQDGLASFVEHYRSGYTEVAEFPSDDELCPYVGWAAQAMRADWEPRVRAGERDPAVLEALDTWASTWPRASGRTR